MGPSQSYIRGPPVPMSSTARPEVSPVPARSPPRRRSCSLARERSESSNAHGAARNRRVAAGTAPTPSLLLAIHRGYRRRRPSLSGRVRGPAVDLDPATPAGTSAAMSGVRYPAVEAPGLRPPGGARRAEGSVAQRRGPVSGGRRLGASTRGCLSRAACGRPIGPVWRGSSRGRNCEREGRIPRVGSRGPGHARRSP